MRPGRASSRYGTDMSSTRIGPTAGEEGPRSLRWTQVDADLLPPQPNDAASALIALNAGNIVFAETGEGGQLEIPVDASAYGLPTDPSGAITHTPFAAALGRSDARVPLEMIFGLASNDMFVVRVAGNVPAAASLGSMRYAAAHLPTIQLVTVVGHSSCGAVTAAVDALLDPGNYLALIHDAPLRLIIDALLAGVRIASLAIEEAQGPTALKGGQGRDELIRVSTIANTAITASVLAQDLDMPVAFGIHDLRERTVGIHDAQGWKPGLRYAPRDDEELLAIVHEAARTPAERVL